MRVQKAQASVLSPYLGASQYANQGERDYNALAEAAASGRVTAERGV